MLIFSNNKEKSMKIIKSNIFNSFLKKDIIIQSITHAWRIYMLSASVIALKLIKLI